MKMQSVLQTKHQLYKNNNNHPNIEVTRNCLRPLNDENKLQAN